MIRTATACLLLAGLFAVSDPAHAQDPPAADPAAATANLLRVFLDCPQCDTVYLLQNVQFVDYVRDRTVADLHILVTTQGTGGGGQAWTLKFIGAGRFQGQDRTLNFSTPQTATSDERRREFARVFRMGLVGYAADTTVGPQLDVTWRRPAVQAQTTPAKDRWNFWVFRVNTGGNFSGEQSSNNRSYRLSFSGNRVTEQWKVNLSASGNRNRSLFKLSETIDIRTETHSWSASALVVRSLGPKWSVATRTSFSRSSFTNTDRVVTLTPGIEFDFFPYAESARRSFTIQYTTSVTSYKFRELTVFDKLEDTIPSHSLTASLGLRQPWGSVSAQALYSQHLNNTDRYRASVFGSTDIRLFKGFTFNVFGEYSKINDQIALRKGTATTEEVLLRLRQLATNYSYYMSFGISYSFGSIFSSVVNPRFGGSGAVIFF